MTDTKEDAEDAEKMKEVAGYIFTFGWGLFFFGCVVALGGAGVLIAFGVGGMLIGVSMTIVAGRTP